MVERKARVGAAFGAVPTEEKPFSQVQNDPGCSTLLRGASAEDVFVDRVAEKRRMPYEPWV